MGIEENKAIVDEFLRRFSVGQFTSALDLLSDDATWWVGGNFPLSGTRSKKEMCEMLTAVTANMPSGLTLSPRGITAEGERVAVEAESYGKHTNGRTYNNHYHFVFVVRDGSIHTIREYLDTMHANWVFCE